jgi:hypothetical protein
MGLSRRNSQEKRYDVVVYTVSLWIRNSTGNDIKCPANFKEKFEDTKGVIRSRKSKDRQYNAGTFTHLKW